FTSSITTNGTYLDLTNAPLTIAGDFIAADLVNQDKTGWVRPIGSNALTFSGDNVINASISPFYSNTGNIVLTDAPVLDASLGSPLHKLANISFTSNDPNKRVSIKGGIQTNNLMFGGLTVGVDNP